MTLSNYSRLLACLLFCGFAMSLTGCGSDLVSLAGSVTIDGKPAPAGISLAFQPVAGGSPSYGITDDQGRFVAAFTHKRMGIKKGEHMIHLLPGGSAADAGKMPATGQQEKKPPSLPADYYREIMKITVGSGQSDIVIPLESSK